MNRKNKLFNTLILSLAVVSFIGCNSGGGNGGGNGNGNGKGKNQSQEENSTEAQECERKIDNAINAPKSTLTQELQDSITYMYSEEKLAKEVYLNVYEKQAVKQLTNIATKSEIKHVETVDRLAVKYDLNITIYPDTPPPYDVKAVQSFANGEFPVVAIQELYDMLYDKGIQSEKDALEVGCMVEVTDVDDLDKYLLQAEASKAEDVITIFNFLRDGSYNHYWAFDKGLKNKGISDGCCSLGTEYCHPEYPQKEK